MLGLGVGIGIWIERAASTIAQAAYTLWLQLQTSMTALYGTAPTVDKSATTYAPACAGNDPDTVLLVAVAPDTPHVISEQAAAGYAPRFDTGVFYDTLANGTLLHPKDADGTYLRYDPWVSGEAVTAGDYCNYAGSYYLATADDAVNTDTPDVASNWVDQGYYRGPFVVATEPVRTNLFLNPATPVTQDVTTTAQAYTISVIGSGDITVSGTATGVATESSPLTVAATAGTMTCTVSGTLTHAQVEAGNAKTSPIISGATTVTRAASSLTSVGSEYASNDGPIEWRNIFTREVGREQWIAQNAAGTQGLYIGAANKIWWRGGDVGANAVSNGDFATDTVWAKDAGWSISGGKAIAASVGTNAKISQSVTTTQGSLYKLKITCDSITSGQFRSYNSATLYGASRSSAGTIEEYFIASGAYTTVAISGISPLSGVFGSISVEPVTQLTSTTSVAANTPITAQVVMDSTAGTSLLINGVEEDSDATMTGGWTPGATVTNNADVAKAYVLNGGVEEVIS